MGVVLVSAVLLLVLVCAIHGQRTDVEFVDKDRCLLQACDIYCDFGFKINATGCPYCECADDPCEDVECGDSEVCKPELCDSYPCKGVAASCVKSAGCEEMECDSCPYGYRTNADGCQTCQCKTEPCEDVKCPTGQTCIAHMGSCLDNDDSCRALPVCIADKRPVPKGPFACPMMDCVSNEYCRYGYEIDAKGCQTCVCKTSPCKGHSCKEGFGCEPRTLSCPDGKQCRAIPVCRVMSLCRHKEALQQMLLLQDAHVPECDKDGSFKPKQCDAKARQCWCINDWGQEVKGTRMSSTWTAEGENTDLFCILNRTVAVDISFTLFHGFKDITIHQEGLQRVLKEHISYWLMVEEVHMTDVDVHPNVTVRGQYAVVKVTVNWGNTYDLPSAVDNMHRRMTSNTCAFYYNGKQLRPNPTSFRARQHFQQQPRVSICGGLRLPVRAEGLKLMVRGVGVVLMFTMFVIAAMLIMRRKRALAAFKRREMSCVDKMEKDVSFGNKLYGIVEAPELPKKAPLPE